MKLTLQTLAHRFGYRITKLRPPGEYRRIDVLSLVVQQYMNRICHRPVLVQIGANDGKRADPVHDFIKQYEWQALLVEPQPRAFAELQATYASHPLITLANCAIAASDGHITFYTVADHVPFRWTGLAQLDRDRLLNALVRHGFPRDPSLIQELRVPAYTLHGLLARHGITSVDILQIDAEGYDFEILRMLDFDLCHPTIIHYEHKNIPLDQQPQCWEFLSSLGYAMAIVYGDTVACKVDNTVLHDIAFRAVAP